MMRPKIAGAGLCCLDHILIAPQIPWGESALVENYRLQGGGLVGTALVACARLGAECRIFSLLGVDEIGDRIASELADEGVALAGVARVPGGASPFSFIHVDEHSGERTIFHRRASGMKPAKLPDLGWIAQCDALLVDDYYPELALAAAKTAHENGVPVVGDVITFDAKKNEELFRHVTVLIAPRNFAARLGPEGDLPAALAAIHRLGPETALITLGADGWLWSAPRRQGKGEAFKVEVVDTTGAGDAFHGAFAYGLARRWEIERCAEFAAAVAAIKCTKTGGRTGLPALAQALDFLKKRGWLDWSAGG